MSMVKGAITAHEGICNDDLVSRVKSLNARSLNFQCSRPNCGQGFESAGKLNAHTKEQHDFEPKPCLFDSCELNKIYTSLKVLRDHISRHHSEIWPTRCLYPGYTLTSTFKPGMYRIHLHKAHSLGDRKARQPYMPTKQSTKT
jgi:hypothetical protein